MKKSLAVMLALIMVLCMIPTTALAANGTGHQISVKIYKVVLDSSKPLGYQNPELVNTITVICQDATGHSGYNHSVKLKEFYPTNFGLPTTDWTGWQFDSYYTKGKDNNTFYNFTSSRVNATANVTGSEPYSCSKNFYLVYKEAAPQTQDITLTYNANGGSGAPGPETKKVEIGKSATFTVSATEPTRENYTFKGWSTDEKAATAEFIGGNSITISQNTTLYAVWANHEHKDGNGDGYCDTDHECMHEKDQGGYCIVDGCTHPHEGDGACCPKKPDNKPNPPKPENTPAIPGLTDIEAAVKVKCETAPKSHKEQTFGFNWSSYKAGEPTLRGNDWFCTITILPGGYVTSYNGFYPNQTHTLNPAEQKEVITLKWDAADKQWENTESNKLPITFTVKCDTVEPTVPNKPGEGVIFDLINKIKVQCIANTDPKHPEKGYDPIEGSYDVGEVSGDKEKGYTCEITVKPEKYVEEYNADVTGTNHTLAAGEGNKTVTLKYDSTNDEWKVATGMPVVFKVTCETVPEETYYIVTYTDGVGSTAFTNQVKRVKSGDPTPAFTGTPSRSGYTFTGWTPAVTDTVTDNVTYTAQWKNNDNHTPGGGNGGGGHWHPTTTPVPVIVIPPKTGDMTIWQSILHFLGIR